jgi:hypothetical protein
MKRLKCELSDPLFIITVCVFDLAVLGRMHNGFG